MKNKRVNIIIALIISMLISNKEVLAYTETRVGSDGKTITVNDNSSVFDGVTTATKQGKQEYMSTYKFGVQWGNSNNEKATHYTYFSYYNAKRGVNYYLYCLDPANFSDNTLYARRFLLSDYNSFEVNVFDTAIMSVLTSNASYHAKSVAIRTLSVLWGFENSKDILPNNESNGSYHLYATYFGQALAWVNNPSAYPNINKYYNELRNIPGSRIEPISSFEGSINYIGNTYVLNEHTFYDYDGGSTVATARVLFENALKEALDYAKAKSGNNSKVEENKNLVPIKTPTVVTSDTSLITYEKTYEFKLNDFTNDGKSEFSIDSLKFDKGYNAVGARLEPYITNIKVNDTVVYDRNSNLGSYNYGENILSKVSGLDYKNIKISVTIKIEANYNVTGSNRVTCANQPMNYTLTYHYDDTSLFNKYNNYVGIVWRGKSTTTGKNNTVIPSQRFISVEQVNNNDTKETKEIKESVTLIDCASCETLAAVCLKTNNRFSPECQELREANCGCTYLDVFRKLGDYSAEAEYNRFCTESCSTNVSNEFQCCDERNDILLISQENKKNIEINGPDNPIACFVSKIDDLRKDDTGYAGVGLNDEAGNTYTKLSNKYCVISCTEDYSMNLPSSKLVSAGRYFTFRMSIEGKKTCYTNTIDKKAFEKDIVDAQVELINAYREYALYSIAQNRINNSGIAKNTDPETNITTYSLSVSVNAPTPSVYNGVVTSYNTPANYNKTDKYESNIRNDVSEGLRSATTRLTNAQNNYRNIINSYNNCTNFDASIVYNPTVTYDYEEYYNSRAYMDEYNRTSGGSYDGSLYDEEWYCDGTVSGNYNRCSGYASTSSNGHYTTKNYMYCDISGCSTSKTQSRQVVSNAIHVKKTDTVSASYRPTTLFYNRYPNGTISKNEREDNTTALENRLPVSLNTRRGIYEYNINITNLGEFYNNGSLGRLAGTGNRAVLATSKFNGLTNYINNSINYNCSYLVNMGEIKEGMLTCDFNSCKNGHCDFECIGPGCENYCKNGKCDYSCIGAGCIYNEGEGSTIFEKEVSLNNLFPNGTVSYNWNKDVNSKAKDTIEMIEGAANRIYNEEPILTITISPSTAKAIRKYNKEQNNVYSNDTLDCYDINNYENIACYSRVITSLVEGTFSGINDNVVSYVKSNRQVGNPYSGYFTTWNKVSENSMLGPSWY